MSNSSLRTWDAETGSLLHTIQLDAAREVIGSPHHRFVVCVHEADGIVVCDAERGDYFRMEASARIAKFLSNGQSLIADRHNKVFVGEGLAVWDFRPVLERLEAEQENEMSSSREIDSPKLQYGLLDNLQVCPLTEGCWTTMLLFTSLRAGFD